MQTSLFPTEIIQPKFNHKSRGRIYTDKIWRELEIHSKINIKVAYGYDLKSGLKPNYWILNNVFECGLDTYQLTEKESLHVGFMCYWDAPPEIWPK